MKQENLTNHIKSIPIKGYQKIMAHHHSV